MADAPVRSSLGKLAFVASLNGAGSVDDHPPRTDAPELSRATWPLQEGGAANDDHSAAGDANADGVLPIAAGALLTDEALRRRFRNRSRRRKSSASSVGDAAVVAALSTSGQQLFSTLIGSGGGSPSLPQSAWRGGGEQETEAETEAAGGGEHILKEQSYPSPLVSSAKVEAVIKASFAKMASLKKMGSLGKMAFLSLDDSVSSNEGGGGEGGDGGDGENLFASPSSSDGVFASALVAASSAHDDAGAHLLPLPAPRVLVEPGQPQLPTFRGRRHSFQQRYTVLCGETGIGNSTHGSGGNEGSNNGVDGGVRETTVGVPGVGGISGASGESSVSRRGSLDSRSESRWRKIRWHEKTAAKRTPCSSRPPRKYRPEHGLDPKTQRARERLASRFSALGFPREGCMQALKEAQLDVELTCKLLLFYYPKGEGVRNMVRSLVRVITTAEMKLTAMLDEFKETMADGTVDERLNAVMVYFEKCDQQNTG